MAVRLDDAREELETEKLPEIRGGDIVKSNDDEHNTVKDLHPENSPISVLKLSDNTASYLARRGINTVKGILECQCSRTSWSSFEEVIRKEIGDALEDHGFDSKVALRIRETFDICCLDLDDSLIIKLRRAGFNTIYDLLSNIRTDMGVNNEEFSDIELALFNAGFDLVDYLT